MPAEKDGKMVPGLAAGGHYDPAETGMHDTPFGKGHLGDLPALYVDENGMATSPVLAPRLKKLEDVKGRSLMIHAGGDNYSDMPAKLGGGGARMACGVIE
jgi:Cu-Zn family superoxide dismutase